MISLLSRIHKLIQAHPITAVGVVLFGIFSLLCLQTMLVMMINGSTLADALPSMSMVVVALTASAAFVTKVCIPLTVITTMFIYVASWALGEGKTQEPEQPLNENVASAKPAIPSVKSSHSVGRPSVASPAPFLSSGTASSLDAQAIISDACSPSVEEGTPSFVPSFKK